MTRVLARAWNGDKMACILIEDSQVTEIKHGTDCEELVRKLGRPKIASGLVSGGVSIDVFVYE